MDFCMPEPPHIVFQFGLLSIVESGVTIDHSACRSQGAPFHAVSFALSLAVSVPSGKARQIPSLDLQINPAPKSV